MLNIKNSNKLPREKGLATQQTPNVAEVFWARAGQYQSYASYPGFALYLALRLIWLHLISPTDLTIRNRSRETGP